MTVSGPYVIRSARPADYDAIAAVVDDWWGRPVLPSLPRLFLDHFHRTSLVAEATHGLNAFLVGPVPDYDGPGRDLVTFERRI